MPSNGELFACEFGCICFFVSLLPLPLKVDGGYVFTLSVCLSLWAGYLKKLWTSYNKTWWMSCTGDKNKLIRVWFRSGCTVDPAYQWDTKRNQSLQPGGGLRSTECCSCLFVYLLELYALLNHRTEPRYTMTLARIGIVARGFLTLVQHQQKQHLFTKDSQTVVTWCKRDGTVANVGPTRVLMVIVFAVCTGWF